MQEILPSTQGATVAAMALLLFRHRNANRFATLVGITLFTCNSHQLLYRILSRVGLSVSYSTVLRKLHALAQDASEALKARGDSVRAGFPNFQAVFDNLNQMRRSWQQTLGHKDQVQSGTAATIIQLENVPQGALDTALVEENMRNQLRKDLTVDDLYNDIDFEHLAGVGAATVMQIAAKHIPALSHHRGRIEELFTVTYKKHPLALRKTTFQTARCSDSDESTTGGVRDVVNDIIHKQLGIAAEWLGKQFIFICGDQLSVDRLRKLQRYMSKTDNPSDRHTWMLVKIEKWHMKWAELKGIFALNWWPDVGSQIYGLHHDVVLLGRTSFNPTKCDYYPAHDIIVDTFEARILDALRCAYFVHRNEFRRNIADSD